jgi:hypothetical protein
VTSPVNAAAFRRGRDQRCPDLWQFLGPLLPSMTKKLEDDTRRFPVN